MKLEIKCLNERGQKKKKKSYHKGKKEEKRNLFASRERERERERVRELQGQCVGKRAEGWMTDCREHQN